jgi:LmbE family N-acetylglucosaminyl deacetylase
MRKVALTLLAHPDDAEIQCAGTLLRLRDLGWDIHIATATRGDCGTMTETPERISEIRTAEAEAAVKLVGGTYHCLDEKDGLVCYDKPTLRKATDLMRRIAPSLVFTHPLQDYMMDHEMIALVARAASFIYAAPNSSSLPLVPGSAVPHLYYTDPVGGIDPLGQPVAPTTVIDITDKLDAKVEMLACHASQRDWLRAHHHMDEYIDSMKRAAAERGKLIGVPAAEGFIQHRGHAYPEDDLLKSLLG